MICRTSDGVRAALTVLLIALSGILVAHFASAQPAKGSYETTADVPLREAPATFTKSLRLFPRVFRSTLLAKKDSG